MAAEASPGSSNGLRTDRIRRFVIVRNVCGVSRRVNCRLDQSPVADCLQRRRCRDTCRMGEQFRRHVELPVRILPFVAAEKCVVLKDGTANNLFIRNLPRPSVDVDLSCLPTSGRGESILSIAAALYGTEDRITGSILSIRFQLRRLREEGAVSKLFVRERDTQVKIKVTPVSHGCALEPACLSSPARTAVRATDAAVLRSRPRTGGARSMSCVRLGHPQSEPWREAVRGHEGACARRCGLRSVGHVPTPSVRPGHDRP